MHFLSLDIFENCKSKSSYKQLGDYLSKMCVIFFTVKLNTEWSSSSTKQKLYIYSNPSIISLLFYLNLNLYLIGKKNISEHFFFAHLFAKQTNTRSYPVRIQSVIDHTFPILVKIENCLRTKENATCRRQCKR